MKPDDPRHGTHRGYTAGCREQCCRHGHMRYMKAYHLGQRPRLVDPTGTRRRIQALMALGWAAPALGDRSGGKTGAWVHEIMRQHRVLSSTAATIAALYEDLSMSFPTAPSAARCRMLAARNGYAPPLAWDDIDNPSESPAPQWNYLIHSAEVHHDVDWVVVERVMAGEAITQVNWAERVEVVRRWEIDGRSLRSLEQLTGWKTERYASAARGTVGSPDSEREVA